MANFPIEGIILYIALGLAVLGAIIAKVVMRRQRAKRIEVVARANGWTFEAERPHLAGEFEGMYPFVKEYNDGLSFLRSTKPTCRHVLAGQYEGHQFRFFQYQYTTGGKNKRTYYFRVLALKTHLAGPNLRIQKEGLFDKLMDALGGEDIDFESDQFSKQFWVKCDNRRFAYDVVNPEMMEYLMPQPQWNWQWSGQNLLLVAKGKMEPRYVLPQLEVAAGFIQRLPRHLETE